MKHEAMKNLSFGIEIEMTNISRQEIAEVVAGHFGTSATFVSSGYDKWVTRDNQNRKWSAVSDSSVRGSTSGRGGELVTPILGWEDIETLQEIVRKLRKAGAKADESCGIHVHVGAEDFTPKTLRNLVNLVNAQEDALTHSLQISDYRRTRWCQPVEEEYLKQLNKRKPKTEDEFATLWYRYCDVTPITRHRRFNDTESINWRGLASIHYDDSRYHLLNLHSYYQGKGIEFRAFNGTLHAGEIKAYIQLCLAICQMALESSTCSPTRTQTDNPAYTFRCWLLRLGFIGEEFSTARTHLLKHVPGNAAWRHGDPTERRQPR